MAVLQRLRQKHVTRGRDDGQKAGIRSRGESAQSPVSALHVVLLLLLLLLLRAHQLMR